jgi:hypothetical protein
MNLADELGVEEGEGCFSLELAGFHKAEHSVIIFALLVLCVQLTVDFEAVLEL